MSLCCLCCNAIQGVLYGNAIDGQRMALAKCLLKLAGLTPRSCAGKSEVVCIKCEKDLENVEQFLSRISEGHRDRLLMDVPMQPTQFTPTFCYGQSDVLAYNNAVSEPIQSLPSTVSNAEISDSKTTNDSLPRKRLRRPPKRYRDEIDSYDNLEKNFKICTYQKKIPSSSLNLYPKMAQLLTSNGNVIGDLVEVQRRGKHPRLRIICRECPEAFIQERQFRQHLSKHMQGKENQTVLNEKVGYPFVETVNFLYLCTLCEKGFQEHSTVRRHFKTSHNEDRPFQCELCPAAFKYKTNLDYHKAKHLNHRNHQCPQCEKKFVLRYELQVHLRIHTGEKPFRCQICSMAFAHRSNLHKHRQAHRQHVNKMIECHKCKTTFKTRMCLKEHYERIHKIFNHHGSESDKTHKDNGDSMNVFDINEGIENTNTLEELPISSSSKIDQNFISQPIDIPISVDGEATDTTLISLIAGNSLNSLDIGETSNSISYSHLAYTKSDLGKSSTSPSSISPIIVHDISSFNKVSSEDCGQSCQNSNIKWTNHNRNIKPIIKILPKNLKIIKIPKTNNSKLQNSYTKSDSGDAKDATSLYTALSCKQLTSPDDCTNMSLTYSTNKPFVSQMNEQNLVTTASVNDTTPYFSTQADNSFIEIPVTSYVNCSTVQNISMGTNLEMVSVDDVTAHELVPEIAGNLQVAADIGLPSCNNNSILKISKCNNINQNQVGTDVRLTPDCNNEVNKNLVTWNHFQNSPHNSSSLKSFEIPNFNIADIDEKDKMIPKLEKCEDMKIINLEESKFNEIWKNAKKFQSSKHNKSPDRVIADPGCTKSPDFSTTTVKKTQLRLKTSPHSLLKSQLHPVSPRSKPLITKVEILPQLNLQQIQGPLFVNEEEKQQKPSTPYVVKIPKEYKFQCSICSKFFKLKSALTKHLRTHTGEKPYKCSICPKSYADASNYKKHKMLHTRAADALNITRPKAPPSPAMSNVTDPDPDGIEVMQTIQPFEQSSGDSDDDMESYLWQDALQHSLLNKEIRENIRRNLKAINSAIKPATENINIAARSLTRIFSPNCFPNKNSD